MNNDNQRFLWGEGWEQKTHLCMNPNISPSLLDMYATHGSGSQKQKRKKKGQAFNEAHLRSAKT